MPDQGARNLCRASARGSLPPADPRRWLRCRTGHRGGSGPDRGTGPAWPDRPRLPPVLAVTPRGSRHCPHCQTFPTTDGYEPARAWCGSARLLHACAPCSPAHRPLATAAVEGANPDPEAEHAVVRPVGCRPDRRPPIVALADPTDLPPPRRTPGEPAHPARTRRAALPHSPGPGPQESD